MLTIGLTTHLSNRAGVCTPFVLILTSPKCEYVLKEWIEVFGHVAVSASGIRMCLENRWNVQDSREGRVLTSRGKVSDGSVVEKLAGVNVVRAANLVVTSEIGNHELPSDLILPKLVA